MAAIIEAIKIIKIINDYCIISYLSCVYMKKQQKISFFFRAIATIAATTIVTTTIR
ncbi:MAG: hypothetical protein QM541_15275 [Flavobacterium sp.]|nr:hypothetical protein [Flavobacterium sp.]